MTHAEAIAIESATRYLTVTLFNVDTCETAQSTEMTMNQKHEANARLEAQDERWRFLTPRAIDAWRRTH